MAIIHDTVYLQSGGRHASLGMLMGTGPTSSVFNTIDAYGYKSLFGDEFDHMNAQFIDQHIRPMEELNFELSRTVNMLMNPDNHRILDSVEAFRSIPSCMELPILMYAPVLEGFRQGRIEGFGYDPDSLPDEDVYGRMLDNFNCEDVAEVCDDEGYYEVSGTMYTDDPDLNDEELYAIRKTREYIRDKILNGTDRDPTAIDLPRG